MYFIYVSVPDLLSFIISNTNNHEFSSTSDLKENSWIYLTLLFEAPIQATPYVLKIVYITTHGFSYQGT